jgi:phage terminase large subunit-like protein
MKGEIKVMSAGGKKKDGLYASVVHADEHGSASYVNGGSDMQQLVDVCWGSCGPRREKLLMHTTTAGLVKDGPYKNKLETVEQDLLKELTYPLGQSTRTPDDYWFAFLLRLDPWETGYDLDQLDNPELFLKVNRSIGITVQPTWYKERLYEARKSEDTRREVLTKDFNIWLGASTKEWIKPEEVRPLQTSLRVDDCTMADGWVTFGGMDFSQGDDLHTVAWLSARRHPSGRGTQFHADCDCWIKQDTLERSAIRALYEEWIERGWLHVSPGKVFQPSLFIGRLDELIKKGVQFMYFGYDKYQSKDPVNSLKAYFQSVLNVTNPEPYVQVVSQLNSEFNAPTDKLYAAMFAPEPFITFSANPLWPWCFGNAVLEIDGRENKRPVKRQPGVDSCKVDPVQAIIMALDLYERYEGAMH